MTKDRPSSVRKRERLHHVSWNWSAFILTILWLGYRKMYLYLSIIVIAVIIFSIVLGFGTTISPWIGLLIGVAVNILLGLFGNYLYLLHAKYKIRKVKQQSSDEKIQRQLIQQSGGTSIKSLAIVAVAIAILMSVLHHFSSTGGQGVTIGTSVDNSSPALTVRGTNYSLYETLYARIASRTSFGTTQLEFLLDYNTNGTWTNVRDLPVVNVNPDDNIYIMPFVIEPSYAGNWRVRILDQGHLIGEKTFKVTDPDS
ncbi:DUF2628 domain-containing protein [Alicyclobacillus acidoterrestris]|uniref:DUF2628 domain-containing protein n=2 Tax=Alicyclobacillus acidoterrestris TaxID=1450 RepID=UPI002342D026|nr:DUF2628 domain-containing protein [Alicyclobacillus acidoterrestris]